MNFSPIPFNSETFNISKADSASSVLYYKSYWTDLNDFTAVGLSASIDSAGRINLAGGGSNGFAQYLLLNNKIFNDERTAIEVTYSMNTPSAASGISGLSVGRKSINPNSGAKYSIVTQFNNASSASNNLYNPDGGALINSVAATTQAHTAGQRLKVGLQQTFNVFNGYIQNQGKSLQPTNNTIPNTYIAGLTWVPPNASQMAIFLMVNSVAITIYTIRVFTTTPRNCFMDWWGDSKTAGSFCGGVETRTATIVSEALGISYAIFAGAGDGTAQILQTVDNQIAYCKARYSNVACGRNDASLAVTQANLPQITNKLKASGRRLIMWLPIPELVDNQGGLRSYIQTQYANEIIFDPSIGFDVNTMLSPDGVHENEYGYRFVASKYLQFLIANNLN